MRSTTLAPGAERPRRRLVAVIDVGSNSIRLVIYEVEGRAVWSIFNEKVLAGLGRDEKRTGRLSRDGVREALGALRRFRAVLDGVRPDLVLTAATAAVREAADREAFTAAVRETAGFELRVLSGEDEARLAALGVAAGAPGAEGVVGDLGGSSLELAWLGPEGPTGGVTLPLGPFALQNARPFDLAALEKACDAVLRPHAARFRTSRFHAVGGAWRNLALVHMTLANYPLKVLHAYEVPARELAEAARFVARQSRGSLERIPGLSRKRAETLPHAAVVLERLIEDLGVEEVVISAYGVREGLVFETLEPEMRGDDPLVAGCATLGGRERSDDTFAPSLQAWLTPVFSALPPVMPGGREPVLLAAACRLSGLGAHLHPDHRAELAFNLVLRAPIPGQSHRERAFLALAAFNRYSALAQSPEPETIERLLTPEQQTRARALGAGLRLGCDLSGRSPILLQSSGLELEAGALTLKVAPEAADMLGGETIIKRANQLAALLAAPLKLRGGR